MRELYPIVASRRVGFLERSDANWEFHLSDADFRRRGMSILRFVVHPRAYAAYRVKLEWQDRGPTSALVVHELIATDPSAYATMCRYLLDIDLVGELTLRRPADDALQHLLANPRVALRSMVEGLWVRLVDVDRALTARRYTVPLDIVLEITDPVCPWNAGRWRLAAGADGRAEVTRTDAAPDLWLGIDDLGAVFLGGTRLTALAAAGRVREARPGVAAWATLAFAHDHEPACVEQF